MNHEIVFFKSRELNMALTQYFARLYLNERNKEINQKNA